MRAKHGASVQTVSLYLRSLEQRVHDDRDLAMELPANDHCDSCAVGVQTATGVKTIGEPGCARGVRTRTVGSLPREVPSRRPSWASTSSSPVCWPAAPTNELHHTGVPALNLPDASGNGPAVRPVTGGCDARRPSTP